jgi:hypothetical protein
LGFGPFAFSFILLLGCSALDLRNQVSWAAQPIKRNIIKKHDLKIYNFSKYFFENGLTDGKLDCTKK